MDSRDDGRLNGVGVTERYDDGGPRLNDARGTEADRCGRKAMAGLMDARGPVLEPMSDTRLVGSGVFINPAPRAIWCRWFEAFIPLTKC